MNKKKQFENWECFLGSMEGCVSVDFSRCGIVSIPDEILEKFSNIQVRIIVIYNYFSNCLYSPNLSEYYQN
jgi:hypothetical protein